MANILAAANGNWSSTATWIGGVVPTTGDNAYANSRTITINVNINVAKLSTQAENGATAGGGFTVTCGVTPITITATTIAAGTTNCLTIASSGFSGRSAIIYATDVYSSSTASSANGISSNANTGETVYFYGGNLRGLTGFNSGGFAIGLNGTHYINANLYASNTTQTHGLTMGNGISPTIYITGNCYGGNSSGVGAYFAASSTPTVTITGNIYAGNNINGAGLSLANNNSVTVIGNVYGGSLGNNCAGVVHGGTGTLNIVGTCEAGPNTGAYGLEIRGAGTTNVKRVKANGYGVGSVGIGIAEGVYVNNQGATLNVEEIEHGSRGLSPVRGHFRLTSLSTNVAVFTLPSSAQKTLVDGNAAGLMPAVTDVRSGVTYNAGNLTGTCAVPAANSVAAGVAVDNTTGTAVLTQANVWDYALSSASSVAGSVGEKLKKTAIPADIIALG